MELLREMFSPDSLSRNSVYISLLVGLACPLIGVFLVLRRLIFMGVALPQISATGVALALSLHVWLGDGHGGHEGAQRSLALVGSLAFSLLTILWLAFMERRGRSQPEGRLGTAYVVAAAISLLLLSRCATAEQGWLHLLKGEIIAVSNHDVLLTLGAFGVVLVCLRLFYKEFLLVSFDRVMAFTLQKRVVVWDLLLYLLIGLTVSVAVLSVGPLISFGFLLIPPLIAHQFARNMRQLFLWSSVIGGVTALAGFALAFRQDLPIGPTDVALLGLLYGASFLWRKIFARTGSKPVTA